MPVFAWRTSLSVEERLEMILDGYSKNLQKLLSRAGEPQWPAADATPHVEITDEKVMIWWGGPTVTDAVVRLRPITREELGV
jgi:hypothetical protein